jgi:hypothetical protein
MDEGSSYIADPNGTWRESSRQKKTAALDTMTIGGTLNYPYPAHLESKKSLPPTHRSTEIIPKV